MSSRTTFLAMAAIVAAGVAPAMVAAPAQADVMASAINATLCLDVNQSTSKVTLYTCHGQANQNFFSAAYGQVHFGRSCLDAAGDGSDLVVEACANKPSQRWGLSPSGELKNEGGWCADIPFQIAYSGARVQMHHCNGGLNQKWYRGTFMRGSGAAAMARPGTVFSAAGQRLGVSTPNGIVAQGGGNIVAQGGGNIVAQGGGNIVAQGGGN